MSIFSRDKKSAPVLVFAIHDSAQGFMMPVFFAAEGVAVRAFGDAVNGGDKAMASHAQEYALYRLGGYDPTTGVIDSQAPELVISGASLVNK